MKPSAQNTDSYIKEHPKNIQLLLKQMRQAIIKIVPEAEEAIRYGIPTIRYQGKNLVHFGGFKDHVSFFPGASGITPFQKELTKYKVSKGTIRFPLDQKLPLPLITKIVRFRLTQFPASPKNTTKKK